MVWALRAPFGMVFWCFTGAFFGILGIPFWTLFSTNQKGFGHLLAWCSGVVWANFFGILGIPFWILFSSNQKATLGTGRVHSSGPSGTSWHGILVFYGRLFWHLGDAILDLVFFESESNVRHPVSMVPAPPRMVFWCGRGAIVGILGIPFWTLFSSNQKATLGTGHVHGSWPPGTSWHGVLVL